MTWWNRLWHRRTMEAYLDKELRFHLEQHAADLIARGCTPEAARKEAWLALGGDEQVKEKCRDARGTRWLEDFWQDLRYALRGLRQKPGFAAVTLCTLALGIGATTLIFSLIYGVLLKPLPYPDPDRLVSVHGHSETWNVGLYGQQNIAYFDFLDCQRDARALELAGWLFNAGTLSEPGEPEYVTEFQASSNLFSMIGVPLLRGRAFLPEEDRAGGAPVAILGYSVWQRRFAGNPEAVGKAVVLNEKRYTVVGIAAAGFQLQGNEADIYTPIGQNTEAFMRNRRPHPVEVIARLRSGATLAQARTELLMIGRRLAQQYPDSNKDRSFIAQPLGPQVGNARSMLWLLLGAVGLVLLIGCVNIASLLLARAISRERELAMRMALGAGRFRLARQCLTESAVLGLGGGALGILLAAVGLRPFVAFWPSGLPRAEEVQLDWHVLVFAMSVSLLSGLLFGLAPALRVPARELEQVLRAGARSVAGSSRRLHAALVVSEMALAVVLLVSAGLLGRTLLRLSSLDPGLNIHNVLISRVALAPSTLANPDKTRAAWEEILARGRAVPGVESIAMVDTVPMRRGSNETGYWLTAAEPAENQKPMVLANSVTPDYLKVTGLALHRGRFIDDHDRMGSEPVAVIDEVMAQQAFGGNDPIGKHVWIGLGNDPLRVVGVVGHVRQWGPAVDDQADKVRAQLYYSFAQLPDGLLRRWSELMSIVVRTGVAPLSVVEPLRREVRGAAGDQVIYQVRTMEQLASATLDQQRFLLLLFGIFAGVALLLACIGIYGVLAYLTNQRVPEIGVRMALGASPGDVLRLVLSQSLGMIFSGIGVGIAAAVAAGRLLSSQVDGVQSSEPLTFVIMIPVLVAAALLASFLPARRASRVDPMRTLRQE
jgi:predicted permease